MGDWSGKAVLVTGGTRGIGLAIGKAFGALGADVVLTHRWGSADEDAIRRQFADLSAPVPSIVEADAGSDEDLDALLELLRPKIDRIELFVSNVAVVQRGDGNFQERALRQSMRWSTWPLKRYVEAIAEAFGEPPRRVVALSSDGHEHFYPGYGYVAASKAALETLCLQMLQRFPSMQCNVVRSRQVHTTSFDEIFGEGARELIARFEPFDLSAETVAETVVALSSGRLDACTGEVIVIDRGATFGDNLVFTGPILLGEATPEFEPVRPTPVTHVQWLDAGVPRPAQDRWPGVTFVGDEEPADAVVAGIDWRAAGEEAIALLTGRLQALRDGGVRPRYAIQIDLGSELSPECAASRSVGRYFDAWRLQEDFRLNFVDVRGAADLATDAVVALTSGQLDALRGQVIRLKERP